MALHPLTGSAPPRGRLMTWTRQQRRQRRHYRRPRLPPPLLLVSSLRRALVRKVLPYPQTFTRRTKATRNPALLTPVYLTERYKFPATKILQPAAASIACSVADRREIEVSEAVDDRRRSHQIPRRHGVPAPPLLPHLATTPSEAAAGSGCFQSTRRPPTRPRKACLVPTGERARHRSRPRHACE